MYDPVHEAICSFSSITHNFSQDLLMLLAVNIARPLTTSTPCTRSHTATSMQTKLILPKLPKSAHLLFALRASAFQDAAQCSHSNFKLGVFIPPMYKICGYEVKFTGMTFYLEKVIGRNGHGPK